MRAFTSTSFAIVTTFAVRVWVPDRPGVLGQVASRIGAVGGDVIGFDILERGGGQAIDEFVVQFSEDAPLGLLSTEIEQVDGVAIEEIRSVDPGRLDASTAALASVAHVIEVEPAKRLDRFAHEVFDTFECTWAAIVDLDHPSYLVELGSAPDAAWIGAFLAGARHLGPGDVDRIAMPDLAWAVLDTPGVAVAIGREQRPFRDLERVQLTLMARIVANLVDRSHVG